MTASQSPYTLRPYQREAVDKTLQHFRRSCDPAVIVLPTGAGKSLVIAELAAMARGRVLVLAHVKELVEQNAEKYNSYGLDAGIFAAGLKRKQVDKKVTFASIQSVGANLERFERAYSLVVVDECHRISLDEDSQYQRVLAKLQQLNPAVKILGLTATPFRLGLGWVYHKHYWGFCRPEQDQFFKSCIYELPLAYMIKNGFLTPFKQLDVAREIYDFSSLQPSSGGHYSGTELNRLLHQYPRVTEAIVADIVLQAKARQGVMIFAATVEHAKEILGYLPQADSRLIIGDTELQQRDEIIQQFKSKAFKFLVNVSVLTTGFDAPHVDLIAVLRPTASVSLFVQIVGRGLRLSPGKEDCLVLDYANNGFNCFAPEVGELKPNPNSEAVQVFCPACEFANCFWGVKDADGKVVEHYGRRCQGLVERPLEPFAYDADGELMVEQVQCDYRFKFKSCRFCEAENDIAARRCQSCGEVLIDADDLLKKALALSKKTVLRCSGMEFITTPKGLKVCYYDEDGLMVSELYDLGNNDKQAQIFAKVFKPQYQRELSPVATPNFNDVAQMCELQAYFKAPDFVIAEKIKRYYRVEEKIFDYQGRYRKAHQI